MKESKQIEFNLIVNNTSVPTRIIMPYDYGMHHIVDSYMHPIPKNCCVLSDTLKKETKEITFWKRGRDKANKAIQVGNKPVFTVSIETDNTHGCESAAKCYENLRKGKCKDAFVIEHIGKKFFASQYAQHVK